jgi:predicted metal-dependent phosphotriesterase family hydrolase
MVGDPFFADEKTDYLLISRTVLPALLDAGVTQEQVDQMLIGNACAFFGAAKPVATSP